jgi:hypothetical protein
MPVIKDGLYTFKPSHEAWPRDPDEELKTLAETLNIAWPLELIPNSTKITTWCLYQIRQQIAQYPAAEAGRFWKLLESQGYI